MTYRNIFRHCLAMATSITVEGCGRATFLFISAVGYMRACWSTVRFSYSRWWCFVMQAHFQSCVANLIRKSSSLWSAGASSEDVIQREPLCYLESNECTKGSSI